MFYVQSLRVPFVNKFFCLILLIFSLCNQPGWEDTSCSDRPEQIEDKHFSVWSTGLYIYAAKTLIYPYLLLLGGRSIKYNMEQYLAFNEYHLHSKTCNVQARK